jgi:hypothetical protein
MVIMIKCNEQVSFAYTNAAVSALKDYQKVTSSGTMKTIRMKTKKVELFQKELIPIQGIQPQHKLNFAVVPLGPRQVQLLCLSQVRSICWLTTLNGVNRLNGR